VLFDAALRFALLFLVEVIDIVDRYRSADQIYDVHFWKDSSAFRNAEQTDESVKK
jgi:hypothetical protein